MATASPPGQGIKNGMKILVIGRNGVGKSSLINKILGAPRAKVGSSVQPTEHKVVEEIHHTVGENNDIPVTVYDTLGFGDAKIKDRSIIEKAISKMKDADIVLICHRLYARFEDTTEKMLKEMIRALGNDLMQHTIIVFTNGDQYLTEWDESSGITAKEQMEEQEKAIKQKMNEIARDIRSIVTSSKKETLPTNEDGSKNWVKDFWELCGQRCTPEAVEFVAWYKRHINTVYLAGGGTAGAVLAGAAGGAALGGIIGSPIVPGIGTVAGATVGTVVGGGAGLIVGGVGGTGLTAAGLKVAEKIEKKKENKENN
uniref:AIG1-type G domain-containing protein n=1 Tax=Amphimedon queenslandica TaxID=400682 RepID=A0A1X7SIN4_AMPQE